MLTVLHEQSETLCASAQVKSGDLWIGAHELETATGWSMKPQGLCRGDVCIPVPPGMTGEYVVGDQVNVSAFWRRMESPLAHEATGELWVLGTSSFERSRLLQSLEAPDFALPDLAGATHTLSEHRGKKVLLVTWASW